MRLLITGDWQADWDNLHTCEEAWTYVLDYAKRERMDAIVVGGDLKKVYNPVDARVTNWWSGAIAKAKKAGLDVILNLGNHDRVGQYADAVNWFPVMRRAGAICVDKGPKVWSINGGQIALLPFCSNKKTLRQWAEDCHQWVSHNAVLIFHEDVKGCRYNQLGTKSEVGIEPEELYPNSYRYCIGSHIHLHQKIQPNIYYSGSPFCQDWGEANQRKGYTVITEDGIKFLPSVIPGWYDPSWPGFHPPEDWRGTRVRIHVTVRGSNDYLGRVEKARRRAEREYEGAEIYVCTNFKKDEQTGKAGIGIDDPDQSKIREYVKQTCPENISPVRAATYLWRKVEKVSGRWVRTGNGAEFLWARGINFLGYEELAMRFDEPGIFVVQGKNHDRGGLSNGSGKTSILQSISVPLFGMTFKGQKHDRWARRNSVKRALAVLALRDSQNRIIKVRRQRRPTVVQLLIDGKDKSAGMQPAAKEGTQGEIEQVTGFTWQTLANAVYIDQTVARAFLAGRKADRTAVLGRFQNLERFERALKLVRQDKSAWKGLLEGQKRSLAVLQERIDGYRRTLSLLVEEGAERVKEAKLEAGRAENAKLGAERKYGPIVDRRKAKAATIETEYRSALTIQRVFDQRIAMLRERAAARRKQANDLLVASKLRECPTCHQVVRADELRSTAHTMQDMAKAIDHKMGTLLTERGVVAAKAAVLEGRHDEMVGKLVVVEKKIREATLAYQFAEQQYREVIRREHDNAGREAIEAKLKRCKVKMQELKDEILEAQHRQELLDYCERALSRDGIPAFLNALLCGPLNAAAEFYAEIFCDGSLQVRFGMEDGEFVPSIINVSGGEDIDAQSDGEKALAGLIASFALREIAPKTNILILDEPGHGLDPVAARKFAIALKSLKSKFNTIFVTTHNQAMLGEWGDEKTIMVEKRNGISRMVN